MGIDNVSITAAGAAATVPTVSTTTPSAITTTIATSGGNVTADGGASVTAKGVCWATTANPVATGSHTSNGTGTGTFTSAITGLTASTLYHVRAYATNSAGTAYGTDLSFTTSTPAAVIPTVSTTTPSAITSTTATSGGNVTADGGASVTAKGVCWATTANPVATGNHTTNGTGTGTFTSAITGLTASTLYHVRAYATNSAGTAYGTDLSFTTSTAGSAPSAPVAITASSITLNSFTANWNASTGATGYYLDVSTSNSFGTFVTGFNNLVVTTTTKSVTGLSASTIYYYRVRAYNTYGTSASSNTISATTTATDPFNGYYTPVAGLTGAALKTGLHNLISTNTYSSYSGAKVYLYQTLDLTAGNVIQCVYIGQNYTVGTTYTGSTDPNTEHTFCQSWMGTSEVNQKTADLHHLFPTNSGVNSSRGNIPYGVVTTQTTTYSSYNGYVSKRGTNAAGQTVFEPSAQHKGDCARALLYFNTRYEMSLSIDGVDMLPTMLAWNTADPVSTWEFNRNASIKTFLTNRNPYIDHPEYVSSVYGTKATNTVLGFSPASAAFDKETGTVTMNVSIENPSPTEPTIAQIIFRDGDSNEVENFVPQTVVFPAGCSTPKEITIKVRNTDMMADDHTLVFGITDVSGGKEARVGFYPTFNLTLKGKGTPDTPQTPTSNGNLVLQNMYPNPFNQSVSIPFSITKTSDVKIEIYNLKGQHIRTLATGMKNAGEYNLSWDGTDAKNVTCPSGIYLVQVKDGNSLSSRKIILMK